MSNLDHVEVVIAGFPKSGTTWASRLVSEMAQAPLLGNWGFDIKNDSLVEGMDRPGQHRCYKSHHTYHELRQIEKTVPPRIIYIIRDPRDIIISGQYFFDFFNEKTKIKGANKLRRLYSKVFNPLYEQNRMTNAVINGDKHINPWLGNSWLSHINTYKNQGNILTIRYEDLIHRGISTCQKILDHIDLALDDQTIQKCIENQSFERRLNAATDQHLHDDLKLLRSGNEGEWESKLDSKNLNKIMDAMGDAMKELGYV